MKTDYSYIENTFKDYFSVIKDKIGKYSEMVMDHTNIWEGIQEIDLEFYPEDNELEVVIYLNGTFLEFPILDVDHHMMGIRAIWPWIEKAYLNLFNVKPLKDFEKVKLSFIDSEGDYDYTYIKFK